MGSTDCCETSVTKYHSTLGNVCEGRRSRIDSEQQSRITKRHKLPSSCNLMKNVRAENVLLDMAPRQWVNG